MEHHDPTLSYSRHRSDLSQVYEKQERKRERINTNRLMLAGQIFSGLVNKVDEGQEDKDWIISKAFYYADDLIKYHEKTKKE